MCKTTTKKKDNVAEHIDHIKAYLYAFWTMETFDMVNILWAGFLIKFVCLGERNLVEYIHRTYSERYTVDQIRSMRYHTLHAHGDQILYVLLWWAGVFGPLPGTGCGSQTSESFNSVFKAD